MFKMEIQWKGEGEWFPCVFPPAPYDTALKRHQEYSQRNPEHNYRIFPTGATK